MLLPLSAEPQRTAHQTALTALRDAVLSGELPGGTRLVQSDIAAQLGLSITPVREALRQLATEGLLRFDSYRGAVVHLPDAAELAETYEMAAALTPLLTAKAARLATAEDVRAATEQHDLMLASSHDLPRWIEANRAFHAAVDGAARSPRLHGVLVALGHVAAPLVAQAVRTDPALLEASNQQHAGILAALAAHDAQALEQQCLQHLSLHPARRAPVGDSPEPASRS